MKVANANIDFKPVFGNTHHIRMVELIGKINKDYESYLIKKKEAKNLKAIKVKIDLNFAQLQRLLDNNK